MGSTRETIRRSPSNSIRHTVSWSGWATVSRRSTWLSDPWLDTDPATHDPSTITDFNGTVGLVFVGGQGTHHNLVTEVTRTLYWEVDVRFMVGTYVDKKGRRQHGAFGFV